MEKGIKLPPDPSDWGFKGKNYLLAIGIDNYVHWPRLYNAVRDTDDIASTLTERYQFVADYVYRLKDEEATKDNIYRKILEVKRTLTPEDNLVVYYSGHGYYDSEIEEGYWVPVDARRDNSADYLSNSDILKHIRAIKAHHTLMIVDSCFSGSLISHSRGEVLSEKYPSARIFASGRKAVEDGTVGSNSPFAKAILKQLKWNSDRVLRASELIQNVTKTVENEVGQEPIEGRIQDTKDEGGEFVFHLKASEVDIWASIVQANTSDGYAKYLEYFPEGKYLREARLRLDALTDDLDWNRALNLNTIHSLSAYLDAHRLGSHADEALQMIKEREENEVWRLAKARHNISGYQEYLYKYPDGRFVKDARETIQKLSNPVVSPEPKPAEDRHLNFQAQIAKAEKFFAQKNYKASTESYHQALKIYQEPFEPTRSLIQERIREAEKAGMQQKQNPRKSKMPIIVLAGMILFLIIISALKGGCGRDNYSPPYDPRKAEQPTTDETIMDTMKK